MSSITVHLFEGLDEVPQRPTIGHTLGTHVPTPMAEAAEAGVDRKLRMNYQYQDGGNGCA
jgi:hypothetical protein